LQIPILAKLKLRPCINRFRILHGRLPTQATAADFRSKPVTSQILADFLASSTPGQPVQA
jgi:hypothetical protein